MTADDPNIEVQLTDDKVLHCFKVIYHIQIENHPEREPLEIYLHATQAFDLFHKLGTVLMEYFAQTSAELLLKVFDQHEARRLLEISQVMLQESAQNSGQFGVAKHAGEIYKFLNRPRK